MSTTEPKGPRHSHWVRCHWTVCIYSFLGPHSGSLVSPSLTPSVQYQAPSLGQGLRSWQWAVKWTGETDSGRVPAYQARGPVCEALHHVCTHVRTPGIKTPVIPALGRLRRGGCEFETSLDWRWALKYHPAYHRETHRHPLVLSHEPAPCQVSTSSRHAQSTVLILQGGLGSSSDPSCWQRVWATCTSSGKGQNSN